MRIYIVLIWLVIAAVAFGQAPIRRNWYSTNVTGTFDPRWTNKPSTFSSAGPTLSPMSPFESFQLTTNFNVWQGAIGSFFYVGMPGLPSSMFTNNSSTIVMGDKALSSAVLTNVDSLRAIGYRVLESAVLNDCHEGTMFIGDLAGRFAEIKNFQSGFAIGDRSLIGANLTNVVGMSFVGQDVGDFVTILDSIRLFVFGNRGIESVYITNCSDIMGLGSDVLGIVGTGSFITNSTRITGLGNDALADTSYHSAQNIMAIGDRAGWLAKFSLSTNILLIGHNSGTNLVLVGKTNLIVLGNIGDTQPENNSIILGDPGMTNVVPGQLNVVKILNAETNIASFDIVTTDFTINTWYTNDDRRASVVVGFELDANTTGTAKAGLYIDQAKDGTFETTLTVQSTAIADPVQHVVTGWLQPGARFAITNLSSGAGSPTVAVVAGASQWVKQ